MLNPDEEGVIHHIFERIVSATNRPICHWRHGFGSPLMAACTEASTTTFDGTPYCTKHANFWRDQQFDLLAKRKATRIVTLIRLVPEERRNTVSRQAPALPD